MTEAATPPEGEEPTPEGAPVSEVPPEQETRIVDRVTTAVKDGLRQLVQDITGKGGEPAAEGEEEGGEEEGTPAEPATPAAVEQTMEERVKAELHRIRADEEHAAEHAKIREAEKAPVTVSKLTRRMWGGGDAA